MAELTLYHLPGACSRVTLTALEHCGLKYRDEIVNLAKGQQHSPEYRAVNPRGKVPALLVDGQLLSENAAILWWLGQTYPDAGLFPETDDPWSRAKVLSDLFWVSSGWHPSVRANMMPVRWTTGNPQPVRERGKQLVQPIFALFEERLAGGPWWFGESWSIIDTYAYWCYTTAEEGEFDLSPFPAIAEHRQRVAEQSAFRLAMAREKAALERMG